MKYSSSIRSVNIAVFALLFLAFGCLGCYFSFAVAPEFFIPNDTQAANFTNDYSYNFVMQLGVLGLAVMIVSALGLFFSVKSMMKENDDKPVVSSFLCYIAIGYIFCIFFFLNAVLFYRLIGMKQIAWWIVVCVILLIASLLATNIPMMKLLEDADSNIILSVLSGVSSAISFCFTLTLAITLAFTAFKNSGTNVGLEIKQLLAYTLIGLATFALSISSCLLFSKNHKAGKITKLPSLLSDLSLICVGGLIITSGTVEYINDGHSLQGISGVYPGLDYVVMAIIVGSLVAIAGMFLLGSNLINFKKKSDVKAA